MVEGTPPVLPSRLDPGRLDDVEARAKAALGRLAVDIDGEATVELLDASGKELEQAGKLGLVARDDEAPQRNALLSFSKKLSSALYVFSSLHASNSSSSRRCSSLRWRGTTTLTSTR